MTLTTKNSKQAIEREIQRDSCHSGARRPHKGTKLIGICRCESRSGDLFTMLRCLYAAEVNTRTHTERGRRREGRVPSVGSCAYFFCLAETVGGHPRETISFFSFYVSFLLLFLVSGLIRAWLAHKSMLSGSLRGYLASCVCAAFVRLLQFNHI